MNASWFLLVGILLVLVFEAWRSPRAYAGFQALTDTGQRRRVFLRWARNAFILFSGLSFVALLTLRRLDAILVLPDEFAMAFGLDDAVRSQAALIFGLAIPGGLVLGMGLRWLLNRRKPKGAPPRVIGNVEAMMPRNAAERWAILPLVFNAGFSEELLYRLVLPLLLTVSGLPVWAAFLAAAAMFGLTHLYQGWRGVLVTSLFGLAMTFVYLVTGQLWLAMVFHAANNLVVLVIRPWLASRVRPAP